MVSLPNLLGAIPMSRFLNFFSLLDVGGRLSLTNVAVYACLYKLVVTPSASLVDIGALLLALANYGHKRYTVANAPVREEALVTVPVDISEQLKTLEDLKTTVNALVVRAGMGR